MVSPVGEALEVADAAMARYAQGDAAAFSTLYDALAPRLRSYLLGLARSRSQAEDLLQQTFLQLHDSRGRFLPGAPVRPWAFSLARNAFIDSVRRQKRQPVSRRDSDPELRVVSEQLPSDEPVARQTAQLLRAELAALPAAQREALLLVRDEGMSHAEAATVLGTTVGGIKLRVHRAVEALRSALAAQESPRG